MKSYEQMPYSYQRNKAKVDEIGRQFKTRTEFYEYGERVSRMSKRTVQNYVLGYCVRAESAESILEGLGIWKTPDEDALKRIEEYADLIKKEAQNMAEKRQ